MLGATFLSISLKFCCIDLHFCFLHKNDSELSNEESFICLLLSAKFLTISFPHFFHPFPPLNQDSLIEVKGLKGRCAGSFVQVMQNSEACSSKALKIN